MTETALTPTPVPFSPNALDDALWFVSLKLPAGTIYRLPAWLDELATQVLVLYRPYALA